MSLKYIRGKPDFVEGVGDIYPVKIKDYDDFNEVSYLLNISKEHFTVSDLPLLKLIIFYASSGGFDLESMVKDYEKLFSIVLRKKVIFTIKVNGDFKFVIDEFQNINCDNYDEVREIIMKQNLIFAPKVYKNKLVQQWAEKALQAKMKNAPKITMEDMLSTISNHSGKSYEELDEATIYQVYTDFYRIRKDKNYETAIIAKSLGADMPIEDYAESLDLFKSPYDDIFVEKDKLNKLNKALGEQ